jgi:DNA-binding response OmpR family regulator
MTAVLIVEDEHHLAQGLKYNLEAEGYTAEIAGDGESALERLTGAASHFDVVVLDVMLPGIDGFAVAAELRSRGQHVPILILTARDQPQDVLRGFESGADDFLTKPFELAILLARVNGLVRRQQWSRQSSVTTSPTNEALPDTLTFAGRTIDFSRLELSARGRTVRLTLMEADLLRYMVRREGRAVSRKELLAKVWGLRDDTDTRAIDNFVVRLRKYVEDVPAQPRHFLTVRGVGYRFVAEPETQ